MLRFAGLAIGALAFIAGCVEPATQTVPKKVSPSQEDLLEHIQYIEKNVNLPPVCDQGFRSIETEACAREVFTGVENEELRFEKDDFLRLYLYSYTFDDRAVIKGLYKQKSGVSERYYQMVNLAAYPQIPGYQDAYLVDFEDLPFHGRCSVITVLYDIEMAELIPAKTYDFQNQKESENGMFIRVDHVLKDGTIIHGQCNRD